MTIFLDNAPSGALHSVGPALGPATVGDLVARARRGDQDAFGRLYERFHGSIHGVLLRLTDSPSLAEDLTSETFFRALRGIERFTADPEYFVLWLVRIARDLADEDVESVRSRREQVTEDMTLLEGVEEGTRSRVLGWLDDERLERSLHSLPLSQRRCITLRFLQQRSISETAGLLECSEGAVKQLQLRGLRNLARLMRPAPRGRRRSA
jgi:RNA polymerase sigma-70 factor (ECF subfamily)